MYTPFNKLPNAARIWVYPAPRPFTAEQLALIDAEAPAFLDSWATHGTPLQASYQVLENQFLILAVNEAAQAASGCSIDSSVGFVKALEQKLRLSLTDRSQVFFLIDGEVKVFPLPQVKPQVNQGAIDSNTTLINTLVATKGELEQKWLIPAGESWLKKHFKNITA